MYIQGGTLEEIVQDLTQELSWSQRMEVNCKETTKVTSLLRRLQVQTLPNATPPIGKINPFSKMNVTF